MQMEVSAYLRDHSRTIEGKQQLIIGAFARALEVIPRQLCDNAGFDATDILNKLRMKHAQGLFYFISLFRWLTVIWISIFCLSTEPLTPNPNSNIGGKWYGVDINAESIADNLEAFVWEPALVKTNAIAAATEAACIILSVDETIQNKQSEKPNAGPPMPQGGMQRALGGRGRGMPRR